MNLPKLQEVDVLRVEDEPVLLALRKACAIAPSGWATAREVAYFYDDEPVPPLTRMRRMAKPLVEARDGDDCKEYRLTAAGKRAKTH